MMMLRRFHTVVACKTTTFNTTVRQFHSTPAVLRKTKSAKRRNAPPQIKLNNIIDVVNNPNVDSQSLIPAFEALSRMTKEKTVQSLSQTHLSQIIKSVKDNVGVQQIALNGIKSINALCKYDPDGFAAEVIQEGGLDVILMLLSTHMEDQRIQELALETLEQLLQHNLFEITDIFYLLVDHLAFRFQEMLEKKRAGEIDLPLFNLVLQNLFHISNFEEGRQLLFEYGSLAAMSDAMRNSDVRKDAKLLAAVIVTLTNLSRVSDQALNDLSKQGAAEIVINSVKLLTDPFPLSYAYALLFNLLEIDDNCVKMIESGAVDVILDSAAAYFSNEYVLTNCLTLLVALIKKGKDVLQVERLGLLPLALAVLNRYERDETLCASAISLTLSSVKSRLTSRQIAIFDESRGDELIANAILNHTTDLTLVSQGILALTYYVNSTEDTQRLKDLNFVESVLSIACENKRHIKLQTHSVVLLYAMCADKSVLEQVKNHKEYVNLLPKLQKTSINKQPMFAKYSERLLNEIHETPDNSTTQIISETSNREQKEQ